MGEVEGFGGNGFFCWFSCLLPFQSSVPSSFMQMGQCSPHLHSSSASLLLCGLFNTRAWGLAATLGGALCFLHLNNCRCFSRGNWPRCPSIKQVCGCWHGIRPRGVLPLPGGCDDGCGLRLLLLGIVMAAGEGAFSLEFCCGTGDSLELALG